MFEKDMKLEEQKFFEVRDFLDSEIVRLGALIKEYRDDIKEQGEDFNRDNPNGGMYSKMELTEIHYDMEKKMIYSEEAAMDIAFYKKLRLAPYFGKVVFRPRNSKNEKTVYIGLRTLQDPQSFEMFVCDWRAPVSALFYDDFDGEAYFDAPRGRITGELMLKRQFKFSGGELTYYVDSDLKIDDDILRDILSSSSGEHLKVIVNSIQREQNKVIRYSDNENLLVLGPAGSGKTSVGFHRIAYLLYRNRTELTSGEVIMFSNNDIFSSYVADIIPELGEMPINYASFYSIFAAEIATANVGDYYSLADDVINGNEERLQSASFKMSKEFLSYLDEAVEDIDPQYEDVKVCDRVIISGEALTQRFIEDTENSRKSRGERLASYVQGVIDEYFINNHKELYAVVDEDTSIDEDTAKLVKKLRRQIKGEAVEMIRRATIVDPVVIYFTVLKSFAEKNNMPHLLDSAKSLSYGVVEFEDALGVLYVKSILGTLAVLTGVKHILIDEAQDLSFVQHTIIKKMFPRAKVTLLADTNQAILPGLNTVDREALAKMYDAKIMSLNKSYRSTKQVNSFAIELLDKEERYDIFERDGEAVDFISGNTEDLISSVKKECEKGKTIAIITKTSHDARNIYKALKRSVENLRLCDNKSCEMGNAPVVMPLALTKGLEFDRVIVVDENGSFADEKNKRFLYLASTRALHKLNIFNLK